MPLATLHRDGAVSVVTLNRSERLNAIGLPLLTDLHAALQAAQQDAGTRAIVLTGAGRAFCAGADLKDGAGEGTGADLGARMADAFQRITRAIVGGPKLVVGAVHGYAVGGGLEWLLNCDLVVAADDLVAFFPEMQLGHFVTGGVTHLLPQALGHQRTMELLVLGERLSAERLHALGLVNRVVPRDEMLDTAMALARSVAERSPLATGLLKQALIGGSAALAAALQAEQAAATRCFDDPDTVQRIAALSKPGAAS